jgi:hypothetical protein
LISINEDNGPVTPNAKSPGFAAPLGHGHLASAAASHDTPVVGAQNARESPAPLEQALQTKFPAEDRPSSQDSAANRSSWVLRIGNMPAAD